MRRITSNVQRQPPRAMTAPLAKPATPPANDDPIPADVAAFEAQLAAEGQTRAGGGGRIGPTTTASQAVEIMYRDAYAEIARRERGGGLFDE